MDNTPHHPLVTPSASADDIVPEQTLSTPHFDEKAVRQARPAVPLEQVKARLLWLVIVLMCSSALLGGVIGLTISQQYGSEQVSTPGTSVAPEESRVGTESGIPSPSGRGQGEGLDEVENSDRVVKSTQNEPDALSQSAADPEEKANDAGPGASDANAEARHADRSRDNSAVDGETMSETPAGDAHATLNGALDEWIAATNARDIERQMGFYSQKVNAFYLTRNVPREAVRAEKSRVFSRANLIDIRAATPGIRLSRDGRTATMRFRKKYAIEGGGEDRRGEVVQELRWHRTDEGWKIVSERDLRVIN